MSEATRQVDIGLLRRKPTAKQWRIEVRAIVNQEREDSIVQFGSATEYVRSLIFNSRDRSSAEENFEQALRAVAASWRPISSPDTERDVRILELVAAYTPESGMGKTLVLFRELNQGDPADDERVRRLKPAALQALEEYFPVEQPPAGAFAEYVRQLEANLVDPDYAAYAVARLHELHRLDAFDHRLERLIERAPGLLWALLAVFVPEPPRDSEALAVLGAIYSHCLHTRDAVANVSELQAAAPSYGFQIAHDERMRPVVSLSGGDRLRIPLNKRDLDLHNAKIGSSVDEMAWRVKLEEIKREASSEPPPVGFSLVGVER